jgi:3',5'-cyclic AMP phosphodiesterase CpdA
MRLLAISDLHVGHPANRAALATIGWHREDWLILAGDVGETPEHLDAALSELAPRFARLVWVPGNHELWATGRGGAVPRGEARYEALVGIARRHGALTPEDPWAPWPSDPGLVIAPLFLLYDYSFRPDSVPEAEVLAWAREEGVACADEVLLDPAPHASRAAWCRARVAAAEARLSALPAGTATILVNHWPLEQGHARLPAVPRFTPWCGTRLTAGWARRFLARAVVYGHLHIRRQFAEGATAFHEVSLGYPRQWDPSRTLESYLRVVL